MDDFVSRETKLNAAKDIVGNFIRGDYGKGLSADDVCKLIGKVYNAIEETVPDPEKRKIGLGS